MPSESFSGSITGDTAGAACLMLPCRSNDAATHGLGSCGCAVGDGRLDETVRSQPDLRQPSVNRRSHVAFGRCWHCVLAGNVPCILAAQNPNLPQFTNERLKAAAERRIFGLL